MAGMTTALKRYADFSGRATREEFWMFFLFQTLIAVGFFVLLFGLVGTGVAMEAITNPGSATGGGAGGVLAGTGMVILMFVWLFYVLAMIVPNAAVIVRRFHDQNLSGWIGGILFVLAFLLNIIGLIFVNLPGLVLLIFMCIDGTPGPNRYGPDPKGRGIADTFA